VVIRISGQADVAAVVALVRASYRGEQSRNGLSGEMNLVRGLRTDERQVGQLISRPGVVILLGEIDGTLVACCQLEERHPTGYLGMLAVDPAYQGFGIGGRMVGEAERMARAWKTAALRILVLDRQRELAAWYERLGYSKTGERIPFPVEAPFSEPLVEGLHLETFVKPLA